MKPPVLLRNSLKTQITLTMLLIFLAGIWSLSYYAQCVLREDMENLFGDQQFSTVSMLAEQIQRELEHRLETLKAIADLSAPALQNGPAAIQAFIQQHPELQVPFSGGNFVTGIDGTAIAGVPIALGRVGLNYSDRDYMISALRDGKATIGEPVIGKTGLGPVVVMAAPIRNERGKIIGALSGVTPLRESNFLDQVRQGRQGKTGGYLLVAPQQRVIVTASNKDRVLESLATPGGNSLFDRFVAGDEGSGVASDPMGVEMLYSVRNVAPAGWRAIGYLPTTEAFYPIRDLQFRLRLVTLLLTLLAGVFTWWLLKRQLSPLLSTANALATIADYEQVPQPLPIVRHDEIGLVISGFNHLLVELAKRETARREGDDAVHHSEARLNRAELAAKSGNWELHRDSGTMVASEGAVRLFGLATTKTAAATIKNLLLPQYHRLHDEAFRKLLESGKPYDIEFKIKTADQGEVKDIRSIAQFDKEQDIVFGIVQDISARKTTEARLQLAADVFTHVREGIMIVDADGLIAEVNDAFTRITGFERHEAIGQNPRILKSDRQTPQFYSGMWQSLADQGYWSGEIWNRRKNGEFYAQGLTISLVRDSLGLTQSYIGLFADITDMKNLQAQLQRIGHYDALTNLPNRVLLADRLQQALAQCHRRNNSAAVVYLDLDDFKAVNDGHGHGVGDALLVALAQRMTAALREGDTLSRIGGDEFVAVLGNLEQDQAYQPVIDRLLLAAAAPVIVGDAALQVSVSIGITLYPQDRSDADLLLRHADQALYVAKQSGKNRYHLFDVAQDAAVNTQREGLQHIRTALEKGEFVLHFQPKVNMRSGKVVGAEALIRWQHPLRGLLPPAAFLPLIENNALAVDLGEWVIDSALTQIELWRHQGLELPVSVNIAARQLQQGDFFLRVSKILAAHPTIRPGDLEMEVLESSAIDDLVHVSQVIKDCQEIGVNFALDDFGTGYSSLTYLKHLPVSMLKIDQSFVRDMLEDPDDLAILEGVIGLASAFRREVIAEGVETVAHGEMLLDLGCELAQGYGIARPMPAIELPRWAAGWRPDARWLDKEPAHRDDIPLLFATVEHDAWIAAVENDLRNEASATSPPLTSRCRFDSWLEGKGRARHAGRVEFQAAERTHREEHALAIELGKLKADGRAREALARLEELDALKSSVLAYLKALHGNGRS